MKDEKGINKETLEQAQNAFDLAEYVYTPAMRSFIDASMVLMEESRANELDKKSTEISVVLDKISNQDTLVILAALTLTLVATMPKAMLDSVKDGTGLIKTLESIKKLSAETEEEIH